MKIARFFTFFLHFFTYFYENFRNLRGGFKIILIFWGGYKKIWNFKGGYENFLNFRGGCEKKFEFRKLAPAPPLGIKKTAPLMPFFTDKVFNFVVVLVRRYFCFLWCFYVILFRRSNYLRIHPKFLFERILGNQKNKKTLYQEIPRNDPESPTPDPEQHLIDWKIFGLRGDRANYAL